jgi:hypothetical protein
VLRGVRSRGCLLSPDAPGRRVSAFASTVRRLGALNSTVPSPGDCVGTPYPRNPVRLARAALRFPGDPSRGVAHAGSDHE